MKCSMELFSTVVTSSYAKNLCVCPNPKPHNASMLTSNTESCKIISDCRKVNACGGHHAKLTSLQKTAIDTF